MRFGLHFRLKYGIFKMKEREHLEDVEYVGR